MAGRKPEKPKTAAQLLRGIEEIASAIETQAQTMRGELAVLRGLVFKEPPD